ncbi:hypothetical protein ABN102_10480 [Proteus vulgaris]
MQANYITPSLEFNTDFSSKSSTANNPRHPLAAHAPTVSCFY